MLRLQDNLRSANGLARVVRSTQTLGLASGAISIMLLTVLTVGVSAQSKSSGGGGGGGASSQAGSGGGGGSSASAEGVARTYMAIAAATNDIAEQLFGIYHDDKNVDYFVLYEPRMVNDLTTYRTFKAPLDQLYDEINGSKEPPPADPKSPPDKTNAGSTLFTQDVMPLVAVPATPRLFRNVNIANVISTLSSIASISSVQSTSVAGQAGTQDADAFIASQLGNLISDKAKFYAPSIMPISNWRIKSIQNSLVEGFALLGRTVVARPDPVTEAYELQAKLTQFIEADKIAVLAAYKTFAKTPSPSGDAAKPVVASAYSTLVSDLKVAISWTAPTAGAAPSTSGSTPAGQGGGGQGGGGQQSGTNSPYASIQADMLQLRAALGSQDKDLLEALDRLETALPAPIQESNNPVYTLWIGQTRQFDDAIHCLQALTAIATTLGTQVQPYGTATSASPGLGSPDTVANIVTRGWQAATILASPKTRLLRVHYEMAQSTEKTTNTLWGLKFFKDSSAVAQLSFMVFGRDSSPEFSSWSLAYYSFQNADDALNADNLQVLNPKSFKPKKRKTPLPPCDSQDAGGNDTSN